MMANSVDSVLSYGNFSDLTVNLSDYNNNGTASINYNRNYPRLLAYFIFYLIIGTISLFELYYFGRYFKRKLVETEESRYIYLLNLLIADTLIPIFIICYIIYKYAEPSIITCLLQIVPPVVALKTQIISILALNANQYICIINPMQYLQYDSCKIAKRVVAISWVVAGFSCLAALFGGVNREYPVQECLGPHVFHRYYIIYTTITFFMVPLILWTFMTLHTLYIRHQQIAQINQVPVQVSVRMGGISMDNHGSITIHHDQQEPVECSLPPPQQPPATSPWQKSVTTITLGLSFFSCYLPHYISHLMYSTSDDLQWRREAIQLLFKGAWLMPLNCIVVDPMSYLFTMQSLRLQSKLDLLSLCKKLFICGERGNT